jgi:hypothetical protein
VGVADTNGRILVTFEPPDFYGGRSCACVHKVEVTYSKQVSRTIGVAVAQGELDRFESERALAIRFFVLHLRLQICDHIFRAMESAANLRQSAHQRMTLRLFGAFLLVARAICDLIQFDH